MQAKQLQNLVTEALHELKAVDVRTLDVHDRSSFTDLMVIASGNSNRHVRSLADNVVKRAKEQGVMPLGMEGEREGEWILVDLGDVVVHIMQPTVRDFYNLEKLWAPGQAESKQAR